MKLREKYTTAGPQWAFREQPMVYATEKSVAPKSVVVFV
jgi:hypothetical protein